MTVKDGSFTASMLKFIQTGATLVLSVAAVLFMLKTYSNSITPEEAQDQAAAMASELIILERLSRSIDILNGNSTKTDTLLANHMTILQNVTARLTIIEKEDELYRGIYGKEFDAIRDLPRPDNTDRTAANQEKNGQQDQRLLAQREGLNALEKITDDLNVRVVRLENNVIE
jgi:hypothetical protein